MTQDELLASVMRKILASREEWDGCYIDITDDSMCIDGWVNKLTEEEVRALNKADLDAKLEREP